MSDAIVRGSSASPIASDVLWAAGASARVAELERLFLADIACRRAAAHAEIDAKFDELIASTQAQLNRLRARAGAEESR